MNHIRPFDSFQEKHIMNEGVKDWLIGGLIALSSIGGVKGQETVKSPTTKTEFQIQQEQSSPDLFKKVMDYHKRIMSHINKMTKEKDDKGYELSSSSEFTATSKLGGRYTKKSVMVTFGDVANLWTSDAFSASLKDNDEITVYVTTEKPDGSVTPKMSQLTLKKGDDGYKEALEIINAL